MQQWAKIQIHEFGEYLGGFQLGQLGQLDGLPGLFYLGGRFLFLRVIFALIRFVVFAVIRRLFARVLRLFARIFRLPGLIPGFLIVGGVLIVSRHFSGILTVRFRYVLPLGHRGFFPFAHIQKIVQIAVQIKILAGITIAVCRIKKSLIVRIGLGIKAVGLVKIEINIKIFLCHRCIPTFMV